MLHSGGGATNQGESERKGTPEKGVSKHSSARTAGGHPHPSRPERWCGPSQRSRTGEAIRVFPDLWERVAQKIYDVNDDPRLEFLEIFTL